jgi:hypothetical protein
LHLRQAVLALTAVLALAVVCAVAWTPRPRAAVRPHQAAPRSSTPAAAAREGAATPDSPAASARNVFEFVDEVPAAPAPAPLGPLTVPPPLDPASALQSSDDPIRLVGFVRRGGALRAALSLTGTLVVLAPGETSQGYSVIAVDEDSGVTVRAPDGSERVLPPLRP